MEERNGHLWNSEYCSCGQDAVTCQKCGRRVCAELTQRREVQPERMGNVCQRCIDLDDFLGEHTGLLTIISPLEKINLTTRMRESLERTMAVLRDLPSPPFAFLDEEEEGQEVTKPDLLIAIPLPSLPQLMARSTVSLPQPLREEGPYVYVDYDGRRIWEG